MGGLGLRFTTTLLIAGLLLGIIIGFTLCALAGQRPWIPGAEAQVLVLLAAAMLVGALATAVLFWLGGHETSQSWLHVALFSVAILMIAAVRVDQMSFVEALLMIIFGSVALVAAAAALSFFRQGEAIELESNWGGLGGALGGWRLSPATSLILSALIFAGGAVVASQVSHDRRQATAGAEAKPSKGADGAKGEQGEKVSVQAFRASSATASQPQPDIAPASTSRSTP